MKKLLLIPTIAMAISASAQQIPQYSQYMFNDFMINPAIAGSKSMSLAQISFRSQWTGFSNDVPVTETASLHGKIMDNMGVGGILINDVTGPISQSGLMLAYAYHIQINQDMKISLGINGMLYQQVLDLNDISLDNPNDLAVQNGKRKAWVPDATFGAYWWGDEGRYYAGVAVPQLFNARIKYYGKSDNKLNYHVRHYLMHGGYRFDINDDFQVEPSALIKFVPAAPIQVDINAKGIYKELAWIGLSYRHKDALAIMIGAKKNNFMAGYAYDATLSNIRKYSGGSHEIFIGLYIDSFGKKSRMSID